MSSNDLARTPDIGTSVGVRGLSGDELSSNDLDMSWIHEYSRIHSVQQLMNKEPLDDIVIQTIYMNHNLEITKINKELLSLTNMNGNKGITKDQLTNIIQDKTNVCHGKYKLFDCVLYTIDLDPKEIQKYINSESTTIGKLKPISFILRNSTVVSPEKLPIPTIDSRTSMRDSSLRCSPTLVLSSGIATIENDIIIRPSLFIFHSLHSILILLQETVVPVIKSIIKNTGHSQSMDGHKHTKKVRITEPIHNRNPGKMNKTRKHI